MKCIIAFMETSIVLYVSVWYPILAFNYIMRTESNNMSYVLMVSLRIMGAIQIDLITFFFMLKGCQLFFLITAIETEITETTYKPKSTVFTIDEVTNGDLETDKEQLESITIDESLANKDNNSVKQTDKSNTTDNQTVTNTGTETMKIEDDFWLHSFNTLKIFLPDILISSLMTCIIQLVFYRQCIWSWLHNISEPLLISYMFNVNLKENEYTFINETIWILQLQIIFYLLGKRLYISALSIVADVKRFYFTVVSIWIGTFCQIGIMTHHPLFSNIVVRNPFTNVAFFLVGILVCIIATKHKINEIPNIQGIYANMKYAFSVIGLKGLSVISVGITFMYIHHIFYYSDTNSCFTAFSGTPCLWMFDICNGKLFPFFALLLFEDYSRREEEHTELENCLQICYDYFIQPIIKLETYNSTFLCYGCVFAFLLHKIITLILGSLATSLIHFIVPLETFLVIYICTNIKGMASYSMQPLVKFLSEKIERNNVLH